MGDVIHIKPAAPNFKGIAKCMNCKHEWRCNEICTEASIECPKCKLYRGLAKYEFLKEGLHFQCPCDSMYFCITQTEVYCPNCGRSHTPYD